MTNPRDDLMALAELAVSNGECASQLEIKDAELRDSLLRNIIAVFEPRLATSRPAAQVVDREVVARLIVGPRLPVPSWSQFTLEQLQKVRWDSTPTAEQKDALNAADAILSLLRPAEDEIEQMASRPLYTHPPKSPDTSAAVLQSHALKQALDCLSEIAAAHIPDCPAHYAGDELSWVQRHVGSLRLKAEIARDGIAAAIRQLPTSKD